MCYLYTHLSINHVSMHLLVLSAFRPPSLMVGVPGIVPSQCTFWCSVLSDCFSTMGSVKLWRLNAPFGAQCFPTLRERGISDVYLIGLNAPFGAQCFPTSAIALNVSSSDAVSMHLLVLSAFRPACGPVWQDGSESQCTFWCSVLSDQTRCPDTPLRLAVSMHLLVLSAFRHGNPPIVNQVFHVSMHLLVLSAFRQGVLMGDTLRIVGLNAPFGAQCFPTDQDSLDTMPQIESLNAPFGAQCFPTH